MDAVTGFHVQHLYERIKSLEARILLVTQLLEALADENTARITLTLMVNELKDANDDAKS